MEILWYSMTVNFNALKRNGLKRKVKACKKDKKERRGNQLW